MSRTVTFYTQHCSINLSPKCIDPSNYYPDRSVLLHRYEPFSTPPLLHQLQENTTLVGDGLQEQLNSRLDIGSADVASPGRHQCRRTVRAEKVATKRRFEVRARIHADGAFSTRWCRVHRRLLHNRHWVGEFAIRAKSALGPVPACLLHMGFWRRWSGLVHFIHFIRSKRELDRK